MNRTRVLEACGTFGAGGARRGQTRRDTFVRVSQAFLAASVTLSSINSPVATVLGALLFALLAGWLKARALRATRARAFLEAEGIRQPAAWIARIAQWQLGDTAGASAAGGSCSTGGGRRAAMLRTIDPSCKVRRVGPSIASLANEALTDKQHHNNMLWSKHALQCSVPQGGNHDCKPVVARE